MGYDTIRPCGTVSLDALFPMKVISCSKEVCY